MTSESVTSVSSPDRRASEYTIREATDLSELAELARVFQAVFRLSDRAAPPSWMMQDTIKAGGVMVGLWHGDEPVGFSWGFAGIENGVPYLYSSGLGVLPGHRAGGHAVGMKLAQRELALERGYERIAWTFSALRSVNAHLYISRLGALGTKYACDYRGSESHDWETEGGVPLDEFVVDWDLNSERVTSRVAAGLPKVPLDGVRIISECSGDPPSVVLESIQGAEGRDRVCCEVPPDFQMLADHISPLAHDWRAKTRASFAKLLDDGLVLSECLFDSATGRAYYMFERPELVR